MPRLARSAEEGALPIELGELALALAMMPRANDLTLRELLEERLDARRGAEPSVAAEEVVGREARLRRRVDMAGVKFGEREVRVAEAATPVS